MKHERTTVAIIGGGPVGLLMALELGRRNIPVVVLSEISGTSTHPKANTHNARAMEIYRRHGISTQLRNVSPLRRYRSDVAYYTRLLGHQLHRVVLPTPAESMEEVRQPGTRWPTPEPQFRVSQMILEPILAERVQQLPTVSVRFKHRVTDIADDGKQVRLDVEGPDGLLSLDADYVIGCDGGKSFLRRVLGVKLEGEGGLALDFMGGQMTATYFRAAGLQARLRHPMAWLNWILLPGFRALIVTIDPEQDLYLLHYQHPPGSKDVKTFQEILDTAIGERIEAEVISAADWRAGVSLVAQRFRVGRCFLVGDAAHLFTPTGGFGLNTGIEDALNLGWKLAAVASGWAGEALLDTYEDERKPIAKRNTDYALILAQRNGQCPVEADIESEGDIGINARELAQQHLAKYARWEFDTPGIQLGASYHASSIVVADGAPQPPDSPIEYVPSGVPGSRLPHVWLSENVSLLDELGWGFTLIDFGDAPTNNWVDAAAMRGIPLKMLLLPQISELRSLLDGPHILVRPDHHIAWRGETDDPGAILDTVTGRGHASVAAQATAVS